MEPLIVQPGEGPRVGGRARILLDAVEIAVVEFDYPPLLAGPERHVHPHHGDGFFVIDGRLAFLLGPDAAEVPGEPGTLAFIPPNVAHTFRNDVDGRTRFVNIHVPGREFGRYMLGEASVFDQVPPPPGGGRPLADAILAPDAAAGVEHALVRAGVVTTSGPWSGGGCFYVLDGALDVEGVELPRRGFAAGVRVEVPAGSPAVTFLQLEPRQGPETTT